MARPLRRRRITRHLLLDRTVRAGFGGDSFSGLMRSRHQAMLPLPAAAPIQSSGFIPGIRYRPQGLRSTLRYMALASHA